MASARFTPRRRNALIAVWLVASAVGFILVESHPLITSAIQNFGSVFAAAIAVVSIRRRPAPHRRAWGLVVASLVCWAIGDIIWSAFDLFNGERPSVSVADIFYLAGYPFLALGLIRMAKLRSKYRPARGLALDAIAMTGAAAMATWYYLVVPAVEGVAGLEKIVWASYPLADVALVAALTMLAFAPGKRGMPTVLIGSGLLLMLVLDVGFAVLPRFGGESWLDLLDVFYPTCNILIALALLHRNASELIEPVPLIFHRIHPARVAFLGVAMFTPPVMTAIQYAQGTRTGAPLLFGSTLGLGGVVYLRLAGLVREHERSQDQLSILASHDALTGLPNRKLLTDRIEHAVTRTTRTDEVVAVLYLDLDRFKAVNDTRGHEAGDQLLIETARRLTTCVREGDTVARIGGDEFAILCEDLDSRGTMNMIADRVVAAIAEPFTVGDGVAVVSASAGLMFPARWTSDAESILRMADAAMYSAKDAGKDRWRVYDESMQAEENDRRTKEVALQQALSNNELELHYQPIVDATSHAIVSFEALVRWNRPGVGLVGPINFIELAEETGLILPIGTWVLHRAAEQLDQWRQSFPDVELHMSINVSARQLDQASFIETVESALAKLQSPPASLTLEVTESVLLVDRDWAKRQLESLKSLGVMLAIDDFGTGYSALAYLSTFPFDIVKIDRAFMNNFDPGAGGATVVEAMISLSHALGLVVVAEGTEVVEQLDALAAIGCDLVQGYYFSKPLPVDEATAYLANHASNLAAQRAA